MSTEGEGNFEQQWELRLRSGKRWARVSFYLGAFTLLSPFVAAGMEETVQRVETLRSLVLLFDALTSISVFAMLPLGAGAVLAGYWAGLRVPKKLRSRGMAVDRMLGMIFGVAAALFVLLFLCVGLLFFA